MEKLNSSLIYKKDFHRRRSKQTGCPEHWEKFRSLRCQRKALLLSKCKNSFTNFPISWKKKGKKFWSVFKSVTKRSSVPTKVVWTKDTKSTVTSFSNRCITHAHSSKLLWLQLKKVQESSTCWNSWPVYFFSIFNIQYPFPDPHQSNFDNRDFPHCFIWHQNYSWGGLRSSIYTRHQQGNRSWWYFHQTS